MWDGNDTDAIFSSVTREHIRKYASINTYDTEPSDNYDIKMQEGVLVGPHYLQKPREDKENQDSTGDSKIVGPNGEEMIKYPSGFWDITLSDLGIGPVTEMWGMGKSNFLHGEKMHLQGDSFVRPICLPAV